MIEKSGGLNGITHALRGFVKTSRSAQTASFFSGIIIFFDDYANTLVAGASMRPLTDACAVSREKLAFIVDATAAPIASIVPISSWIGFEISLIQAELDKILEIDPESAIASSSAFAVFMATISKFGGFFLSFLYCSNLRPCLTESIIYCFRLPCFDRISLLLHLHADVYSSPHSVWGKYRYA